jgi:glycosyltransferase involved in cell wall biosynthesis
LLCAVLQRLAGLSGEEVFHARGGVAAPPAGRGQRPPRPFCVGIACRLSQPQKRVLDGGSAWMELRRRHPEVRLLVAGSGENEAALRDLLRDELASGQAEFLGALSPSDMDRAFYPRVDAVLISSPAEVGPLVAWEAMAREIPVVSSRFLGCRTERALVHGLTALLFDVGDTQAAARRLSELLTDRALSRSIAEQGRAFAEQHCSAAGCGAQWAEVFAQVAALRAREPAGMGTCVQAAGGWLDARLGPVLAESVRRFLPSPSRRVLTCSSAEWPHTHSACAADEQARFMALAAELERDAT